MNRQAADKHARIFLERPSREQVQALPVFAGLTPSDIVLVQGPSEAEQARLAFVDSRALGFDTESKPNFLPGQPKTGPHLIQVATADRAFLFRPEWPDGHEVLRAALQDSGVLKIGFGLASDRGPLNANLHIKLNNTLDLSAVVRRLGYRDQVGVQAAVAIVLGRRLQKSKKLQTSNWAAKTLSTPQLVYAANDAFASIKVYERLRTEHAELFASGPGQPGAHARA
jgi:ribonuclease D